MPRNNIKYNIEIAKEIFKKNNMELLEKEYINTNTSMKYKCKICGYEGGKRLSNLLTGYGCNGCGYKKMAEKRKYTIEEAREIFKKNNFKLLENKYKNNSIAMKCKCLICNYKGKKRLGDLIQGYGCLNCAGKKKYTMEEAKKLFLEKNIKCLEKEYINNNTLMKYKCLICNYKGRKKLRDLIQGRGCLSCAGLVKYTIEEAKQIFKDNDMDLLEKNYINCDTKMKYKCLKCSYIGEKRLYSLSKGNGCPQCFKRNNKGSNHPMWNSNLTDEERENNKSRTSDPRVKKWSKKIKERDNYICQKCFNKGGNLVSHHKNCWANFPEQRYLLSNGITLCIPCHNLLNKKYSKKTTSFLTNFFLNKHMYNLNNKAI